MNEEIIAEIISGIALIVVLIGAMIALIIYYKETGKTLKEQAKLKNEFYKKALTLMQGIEKTTVYKNGLWYQMFYGKDEEK